MEEMMPALWSGAHFYRVRMRDVVQAKKMIMLKRRKQRWGTVIRGALFATKSRFLDSAHERDSEMRTISFIGNEIARLSRFSVPGRLRSENQSRNDASLAFSTPWLRAKT